jgi:hypothetical protein
VVFPGLRRILGLEQAASGYRAGERVDLPSDAYADASQTLILFVRSSCVGCQEAKPLFVDMVRWAFSNRISVKAVVPSSNRESHVNYARGLGLTDDSVLPDPIRGFRVRVVPTVLLVDRTGLILQASEGGGEALHQLLARTTLGGGL